MTPAAQELYASLTAGMNEANAIMAAKPWGPAFRNALAEYNDLRDAREALDPVGAAAARAEWDFQATHALSNSL